MRPEEFVAKWRNINFGEKQASQEMFLDICALVEHPTPVVHGDRDAFTLEKRVPNGAADAYLEGHFVWEFKGSDADLDAAMNQALRYQVYLGTPPLLIVSSFRTIRIRTNFPGMVTVLHEIPVAELDQPENLAMLRQVFHASDEFRVNYTLEQATEDTAKLFQAIVTDMERHSDDLEKLARYLNQIVFCLYAEDAGLLPRNLFSGILRKHNHAPATFDRAVRNLFEQMAGGGLFGSAEVSHFNGDLFNSVDTVELSGAALLLLHQASQKDWRNIEPSIAGTLFERALDATKRSQLGAHYTSAEDIMLVVEPVVMAPLRREWESVQREVGDLLIEDDRDQARVRLEAFRQRLFEVTVLDPACGSGNFLYLALRSLLDLEKEVIDFDAAQAWDSRAPEERPDLTPRVKPDQMMGMEINPYAAELARTSLWIGYIQWHQNNGFPYTQQPILTSLVSVAQTDSILADGDTAEPREREWPPAEFIIGNPPFLGGKLLRKQLGDEYVDALFGAYQGRVPAEADFVCYWFEKARAMLEQGRAKRAGLLATQGIRGGANRRVLQRIKESGDIFLAWSDQPWILDGATVHISIVGFDDGSELNRELDGGAVGSINANLTMGADLTAAARLGENLGIAFMGDTKGGPFDIPGTLAKDMLAIPNPHGRSNAEVIRPWVNGRDITDRSRGMWIIDFGDMPSEQAAFYEAPFEYVNAWVRPSRIGNKRQLYAENWWLHMEPRPGLREAARSLSRLIVTPRVSKHRLFAWIEKETLPDSATIAIARDDDYTFGVLHSRFHELWARGMGTQLREMESGFRYTPTTCFETFPFPEPDEAQRAAVAAAAARLNQLREGWLNPPNATASELKRRTLTNLYNQRPTWLVNDHAALDAAVAAAYGWPDGLSDVDILERLLALNLQRSAEPAYG